MGDGRGEDISVRRPANVRRVTPSILDLLLSTISSELGLRGLLRVAPWLEGDVWLRVEEIESRCEGGGRGEVSLCRLPDETVEECDGTSAEDVPIPCGQYAARPINVSAIPSS